MLLHDLSAPTRHVEFFLEQFTRSLEDPTPAQSDWLRLMHENLETQKTLLRDSRLLLAHERQPTIPWERPVRGRAILEEVVASFQPEFDEHGLVLRVDLSSDPPLLVDPQALGRVVSNLLGNALKATPRGGTITLASRLEGPMMMFSVSDTGGGFTPQQAAGLTRRWDDYEQGIAPPDIWGGLGLLVCQSIVMRYGGHLSMVSEGPGLGSTFSFGLRIATTIQAPLPKVTSTQDDNAVRSAPSTGIRAITDESFYGQ